MSRVKVDLDILSQLKAQLTKTVNELENAARDLALNKAATNGWNDEKKQQFEKTMKQIQSLVLSPLPALNICISRINSMAQAITSFSQVSF